MFAIDHSTNYVLIVYNMFSVYKIRVSIQIAQRKKYFTNCNAQVPSLLGEFQYLLLIFPSLYIKYLGHAYDMFIFLYIDRYFLLSTTNNTYCKSKNEFTVE